MLFFLPKNCIFRKSYFHHSEPRHGAVAKQGAASLAVLLHHGSGPEHEAMLAAHLAEALVTHAAPLPAHVRLREPPGANSGSLRGQTRSLPVSKQNHMRNCVQQYISICGLWL